MRPIALRLPAVPIVLGLALLVGTLPLAAQANPTLTTQASAGGPLGTAVSDSATLAGSASATGSLTFTLYGPGNPTCSGVAIFTSIVPVNGDNTYTSLPVVPASPGIYYWVAGYSGDPNNNPVTTACLDAQEMVIITNAAPTVSTTATSSATVGTNISDTALLASGASPTGTITFSLFGPGDTTCSSSSVFTSVMAVSGNGSYPSASFATSSPGTYRWTAAYSGDATNDPASTSCNDANESTTVTAAATTLTTTASGSVTIGGPISDAATLSGGFNPTGTIAFASYGPDDATCSGSPVYSANVLVAGNGNYNSGVFGPSVAGTYRWTASYSGDANNATSVSDCNAPNESVVVSQATTTLVTAASPTVAAGGDISDSGTLSGGSSPSGTILFSLYAPGDTTCSGSAVFTASVPVSGNGVYPSGNFTATTVGTYRWTAGYSGDVNNASSSSACNALGESVVVTQATPTVVTNASPTVALGGQVSDAATLAGGVNPTGSITFNLYGPNDASCSGSVAFTATVPVSGNAIYSSGSFTPSSAGTYLWIASYSGDANHAAVATACNDALESVTVSPAVTALATMSSSGVTVGGSISDTATLSGGINPTGTITFNLYGPDDATCGGASVFTSAVPVSGNGSYPSGSFVTAAAGVYRWTAAYSGDADNAASTSPCNAPNESVVVGLGGTTLTTTASPSVAVGGNISDSATLAGGVNPTGSITFTLFGPNNATCGGAAIASSSATVSGNGTYPSASFTTSSAGVYRWVAVYSGDSNNSSATSPCNAANESVNVTQAPATLSTTASGSVTVGGNISDSATLAGGASPTGTVTFSLFGPNDATCGMPAVFTSSVPVTGNGTYNSAPFTTSAAGTYRWTAAYSGDANNTAVTSGCNAPNESVTVTANTLTITNSTPSSVAVGTPVSDTAVVSGGTNPTGTLTFNLYGPNDSDCSGTPIFTSTVTVSGNGSYTSASFTPSTPGTYRWVVMYSGDGNNEATSTLCSDPNAVFSVATVAAVPTLDSLGLMLLAMGLAMIGVMTLTTVRG